MSEYSVGDPNSKPHDADPPESDHCAADHIPPDPLLKSGTFIDVNIDHHEDRNGDVQHTKPTKDERPETESEERTRPGTEATTVAAETPSSQRRPRRAPEEVAAAVSAAMAERPDWLPEGWRIDFRVRSSGVSAGTIDRYYVEPVSGRRFRSKKEVLHFLETGSKRKRKLNPDVDVMPSDSSGGHKQKKSGSRANNSATLNFDFENAPKEVTWVLTDASEDIWTPVVGDETVPESSKQEWAAAFSHLSQLGKNGGTLN